MASVNKVILIGNLGADPETRHMANGDAVTTIRMATTESWKDKKSGEIRDSTEWHRVVFYRKLAEIAGQYLKKGAQVYLEGRIKTRKWRDREENERYTTEIEAMEMKILNSANRDEKPENTAIRAAKPIELDEFGIARSGKPPAWIDDLPF